MNNYCCKFLLCLSLVIGIMGCHNDEGRLSSSSHPAIIPSKSLPFAAYISQNKNNIKTAIQLFRYAREKNPFNNYAIDDVVNMRAPYQIVPDASACSAVQHKDVGFLLLHGLSDSPYVFKDITAYLKENYPCALIRATLMPGHGTVPGDSLDVHYQDWITVINYGMHSFVGSKVKKLYLVGFSTGTTLALNHVMQHGNKISFDIADEGIDIAGLILLSPAMEALSKEAYLTPYIRYIKKYVDTYGDHDAAKYETFSYNFAAEFYLLTQLLDKNKPIHLPVFMALSSDDQTINQQVSVNYFCNQVNNTQKRMILYQGLNQISQPCTEISVINDITNRSANNKYRFINHSHLGITLVSSNSHYGFDKVYKQCLSYYGKATYDKCVNDNASTLYGELNILKDKSIMGDKLLRRATANPNFDGMMSVVGDFINSTYPL